MKKFLLVLATTGLVMTGCSQSEIIGEAPEAQTGKIGFASHVNKGTRALTVDNFNNFFVYGSYQMPNSETNIQIFNGTEVSKSGNTWIYNDTRYWVEGATYRFAAYGIDGNTLPAGTNANFNSNKDLNLIKYNCAGQQDVVYAKKENIIGKAEGNSVVDMQFNHILSRVKFQINNLFPEGYNIRIADFKLINIRNIGNYYGEKNSWLNPDGAENEYKEPYREPSNLEITPSFDGDDNANANGTITTNFAYVIPYTYTEANVKISFRVFVTYKKENETTEIFDKTLTASLQPNWIMNHQYLYKINITGSSAGLDPIEFSGTVNDWNTEENGSDITIDSGELPTEND